MSAESIADSLSPLRVVHDFEQLFECMHQFPRELVILKEENPLSAEQLHGYALRMGGIMEARGFGQIRVIQYEKDITNSTALSLSALPFHTDGTFLDGPPSRFMLSCISDDEGGGGVSTFYPVDDLLRVLPAWTEAALRTADFLFPQTYDGNLASSSIAPILTTGADARTHVRWRSDDLFRPPVVNARGTRADEAVVWLHDHLQRSQPIKYRAKPGETILVPNLAILHGRTALTPGSRRQVLRVWVA